MQNLFAKFSFEEELTSYRFLLRVLTFSIVPILVVISVYDILTAQYLALMLLGILISSMLFVIVYAQSEQDRDREIRLYRLIFRAQIYLIGSYLLFAIGVDGRIEMSSWSFVLLLLSFLVMGPKAGLIFASVFIGALALLLYWFNEPLLIEKSIVFLRIFSSQIIFSLILFGAQHARNTYRFNLARAHTELEEVQLRTRKLNEDLTAEKNRRDQVETKLRQAHKMEAIGRLSSAVAHDLNNVLTGITSYPDLLLLQLPPESPLIKPMQSIKRSGLKAAAIVQDLLTLSRRGVNINKTVDLRSLIEQYLESPEFEQIQSNHPQVKIEFKFEDTQSYIQGSTIHLWKTLMNLMLNSAEAMSEGGILEIELQNRIVEASDVEQLGNVPEGEYVVLTVKDTGIGMSAEDIEHIYEPFYSRKTMGRSGTGLGMTVVWGAIQDHNGYIHIDSALDEGTTITIHFPRSREELKESSVNVELADIKGQGERILVVDDMDEIRELLSAMLLRLNYKVETAASGEEAVSYLQENLVDLVVLDMTMPGGIDGLETYERMLKLHPGQKAIFTSGYAKTEKIREAQKLGAGPFLSKPYTVKDIGKVVVGELAKQI